MKSLLFIIALGIAAIASIMFPPVGILLFIVLGLWLSFAIVTGGVKGLLALFSFARGK